MPDILSDDEMHALAAEYVLGTLEADERVRAHAMLDVDHGFRAMVRIWERRFGELHLMVEPVDPPPQIWERIKEQLAIIAPATSIPAASVAAASGSAASGSAASDSPPTAALGQPAAAASAGPATEEKLPAAASAELAVAEAAGEARIEEGATGLAAAPGEDLAEHLAKGSVHDLTPDLPGSSVEDVAPAALTLPKAETRIPAAPAAADAGRSLRLWRALALAATFIALALVALGAAWKFAPHRLPAALQGLFQPSGGAPPPARPPAPPFEE